MGAEARKGLSVPERPSLDQELPAKSSQVGTPWPTSLKPRLRGNGTLALLHSAKACLRHAQHHLTMVGSHHHCLLDVQQIKQRFEVVPEVLPPLPVRFIVRHEMDRV